MQGDMGNPLILLFLKPPLAHNTFERGPRGSSSKTQISNNYIGRELDEGVSFNSTDNIVYEDPSSEPQKQLIGQLIIKTGAGWLAG